MMNFKRFLPVAVLLIPLSFAVASETLRLPKGASTGETGPAGCPVFTADVVIQNVNAARKEIEFSEDGRKSVLKVDGETTLRVPGADPASTSLDALTRGSAAKVKYCGTDGKLIEVKVLRDKTS